jgi:hypothetical protein
MGEQKRRAKAKERAEAHHFHVRRMIGVRDTDDVPDVDYAIQLAVSRNYRLSQLKTMLQIA